MSGEGREGGVLSPGYSGGRMAWVQLGEVLSRAPRYSPYGGLGVEEDNTGGGKGDPCKKRKKKLTVCRVVKNRWLAPCIVKPASMALSGLSSNEELESWLGEWRIYDVRALSQRFFYAPLSYLRR